MLENSIELISVDGPHPLVKNRGHFLLKSLTLHKTLYGVDAYL
jgi:hypothetical protein